MTQKYHSTDGLRFALDQGVLTVMLDNVKRRNALTDASVKAFIQGMETAQSDEEVRAVVVMGAGDDFCSGFDIVQRNTGEKRPRVGAIQRRLPNQAHRLILLLLELQVPVVAAVRGWAAGIGMQLVLASDLAVVGSSAMLWEPFEQRGMTPDSGATWLLPRIVGPVKARELLLLGRRIIGEEALAFGIAHRCVPDQEVASTADTLARSLANGPTVALGLTKALINSGMEQPLRAHLADEAYAMELSSRSIDFREGLSAFVEKRTPKFTGR